MLLFAYGTLKRGGKYHSYLDEASLVAERATAKGTLYDTGLGYPALVLSGTDEIEGEVYEIPNVLWPALDYLEDYSGEIETDLYDKRVIQVQTNQGELETAVYIARDEKLMKEKIEDGCWNNAIYQ